MLQEEFKKKNVKAWNINFYHQIQASWRSQGPQNIFGVDVTTWEQCRLQFYSEPFHAMEPQQKSLQESLRISRKFPTPFFCCKAVKLRLSHALKTMSLEIFLSRFFSLHVVWTQQLLRQIKLNSLIMHIKILGQIQFAWRPFPQRWLDWQLTISHQWPLCELDLFGIHLLIQKLICISSYSLADMK